MNIDNEPGRRRCKNHKAPLLPEIKITREEGLQGSFAHLEIIEDWEICFFPEEKYVLLQRHKVSYAVWYIFEKNQSQVSV